MISIERLKELLSYDDSTGDFVWRVNRRAVKAGDVAGKTNSKGYRMIGADGASYQSHRLAWFYVYGEWPADQIDHINGDKLDNRIANLRQATPSQNHQNRRFAISGCRSGLLGAAWHRQLGKWQSCIRVNGKSKYLGVFDTAEQAHAAYLAAKEKLHPFQTICGDSK